MHRKPARDCMAAPCAPVMQDFEDLAGQVFDSADADGDGQVTKLDLFEFTTDNQARLAGHSKAPPALDYH